jgi:hypothetical protein
MRWLKRRLRNWINSEDEIETLSINKLVSTRSSNELEGEPIRFNIFRANGGTVVQTYIYDRQRDRSNTQLHIIGHGQDIGESLGKIITMESLRG